jgi:hypothetical protein
MSRVHQLAINDEGFVFDPSTGQSFTVNQGGLAILNGLKEGKNAADIATALREMHDVTFEDVERDVTDFIGHLKIYRLL